LTHKAQIEEEKKQPASINRMCGKFPERIAVKSTPVNSTNKRNPIQSMTSNKQKKQKIIV